ncbi:MAG: NAD(P)H-dependent flavin oxidoreductase [Planctomycetota bacterium]
MSDSNSDSTFSAMPGMKIGELDIKVPIVQGGMGLGVSLAGLASAVSNQGAIGVISAVGIGMYDDEFPDAPHQTNLKCLREEIIKAKKMTNGVLGFNVMVALSNYTDYVREAQSEGIDIVFSGAGLPFDLPGSLIPGRKRPMLVPIVSSGRAAVMISRRWKKRYDIMPDAFVVEGPLAGGHLGFLREQIDDPAFSLESILVEVIESLKDYKTDNGDEIPVIAAGGIFDGSDILKVLNLGAAGVQMGTRFVATE